VDSIILLALAGATVAKTLVDLLKMAMDTPRWVQPAAGIVAGILTILLMEVADRVAIDLAVGAQIVLAGILAAGSAIGVTELQKYAARSQEERDVARGVPQ
jgi:hypothetical protein